MYNSKTFALRAIVEGWRHFQINPLLVAPTGRGAHRMGELTGHEASTVHRYD
jgi:exodeoxyribonuclease V alpha subunit